MRRLTAASWKTKSVCYRERSSTSGCSELKPSRWCLVLPHPQLPLSPPTANRQPSPRILLPTPSLPPCLQVSLRGITWDKLLRPDKKGLWWTPAAGEVLPGSGADAAVSGAISAMLKGADGEAAGARHVQSRLIVTYMHYTFPFITVLLCSAAVSAAAAVQACPAHTHVLPPSTEDHTLNPLACLPA